MRKFMAALTVMAVLSSCNAQKNVAQNETTRTTKVCNATSPLARVGNETITFSYYNKIWNSIPYWAKQKLYKGEAGKKKLLEKIIDRRLVIMWAKDNGIFNLPENKRQIDNFKERQLAFKYLNARIGKVKITDKDIQGIINKYYKGQKVSNATKRSIRIDLEAMKIEKKRSEIINSISSKTKFFFKKSYKPSDVTAKYKDIKVRYADIAPLIGKSNNKSVLKNDIVYFLMYKLALQNGIKEDRGIQEGLTYLRENIATSAFNKKLINEVKLTDKEVKDYYDKHRSEFKSPAMADISIVVMPSEKQAKKAEDNLLNGKPLNKVIDKATLSTLKRWRVTSRDINSNPVSKLVFTDKKNANVLTLPNGKVLLIIVNRRYPSKPLMYGDVYENLKQMIKVIKARKLAKAEVQKLKEKYPVTLIDKNIDCL